MINLLLIGVLLSLAAAFTGTLFALSIQRRLLLWDQIERKAWESAQEMHQLNWEKQQAKRTGTIERKLTSHVEQVRKEWAEWQARDQDRTGRMRLEYELRSLPMVDHMPLTPDNADRTHVLPAGWRPPILEKADLRGRDFAQRYLGHACLREADLSEANFYMADLRNACLVGANLSNANLTGANLSGADLRGATLNGATLLVSDLHGTLLHGANLLGASSLTPQQLYTAHYDHTTLLEPELDLTMPRLPSTPTPVSQ
jgi:hypothetical protein